MHADGSWKGEGYVRECVTGGWGIQFTLYTSIYIYFWSNKNHPLLLNWKFRRANHRVHIGGIVEISGSVSALSAGAYTTALLVMG